MEEKFLMDTSSVIKFLNSTFSDNGMQFFDEELDRECVISFITEIELLVWDPDNPNDLDVYKDFVAQSTVLWVSQDIINKTIAIRKEYGLKLPDAMIGATAIIHNRTLVADNDKDFKRISNIKYINPNDIH